MQRKSIVKLGVALISLGAVLGCAALVFKQELVTFLRLGTQLDDISIPKNILLLEEKEIGKTFKVNGIVGLRAMGVEVAMVPRINGYEPIEWENAVFTKTYPKTFEWEFNIPEKPQLLYVKPYRWDSHRLASPVLVRPALLFIIIGQSNASGASEHISVSATDNVYYGSLGEKGIDWRPAHDPGGLNARGSVWPLVGHELQQRHNTAVGFINLAVGGTSIDQWQPGGEFYQNLLDALSWSESIGLTAILWHQGESDHHLSEEAYASKLENLIVSSRSANNHPKTPWLISTASLSMDAVSEALRTAQKEVVDPDNYIFPGPDTDVIGTEHRDAKYQAHFTREGNLLASDLWVTAIESFLSSNP